MTSPLNISSIVWLYRGESDRFLDLVRSYLTNASQTATDVSEAITPWNEAAAELVKRLSDFASFDWSIFPDEESATDDDKIIRPAKQSIDQYADNSSELEDAWNAYLSDCTSLFKQVASFEKWFQKNDPVTCKKQHKAHERFVVVAEAIRGLVKQVDHVAKLASATINTANKQLSAGKHKAWNGGDIRRLEQAVIKPPKVDAAEAEQSKHLRPQVSAALRLPPYFHRQVHWLLSRFPDAELVDVPGLCCLTPRSEIEANDWSLTPGRYVGVAPPEEDEDFDFEERMREIHIELKGLNEEAMELAETIEANLAEIVG